MLHVTDNAAHLWNTLEHNIEKVGATLRKWAFWAPLHSLLNVSSRADNAKYRIGANEGCRTHAGNKGTKSLLHKIAYHVEKESIVSALHSLIDVGIRADDAGGLAT